MSFTGEEVAYIRSQRLARISTVDADGQPDVVPVGYEFDGTHFYIGGLDPASTRRHRNIEAGNHKVALVIDDLASTNPWSPRYLRVYGTAELVEHETQFGRQPAMKIISAVSWSFNLGGDPLSHAAGRVVPRRAIHQGGTA